MVAVLEGIRVLEVAEHGFVPSAASVLGDWGADVVKIERPQGDALRDVQPQGLVVDTGDDFQFLVEQMNRNKRNVCLDLKNPEARPVFDALVRASDVFITNQLPQVRRKLAIEPDDLFALNPRLVYARGHGQGARGPDAESGGFDSVSFWSRAGVGHMLSGDHIAGQRPGMGDVPSGMFLAGGIGAALFHRERSGRGIVVDVALMAGGIWTLAPDLVAASVLGGDPPKGGSGASTVPLVGSYLTSDGRVLMLSMLATEKYWQVGCEALEAEDLVTAHPDEASRAENIAAIRERFRKNIAAKPLAHWEQRLRDGGCIYSKYANPQEVLADPQTEANGYLPRHPTHPTARLASSPVQFGEEPIEIRRAAPDRGQHTDEVLDELGIDPDQRSRLREAGAIE
ncbi:CoA transferase [Myxococcota bacterium]|nr:CoA transferase [Myxococcota bacterium]